MKFNADRGESSANVIRLKDGESVTGVLRGDILEYERAYNAGDKPKFRFKVNMIFSENGALVAKILEGGWKLYRSLSDLQNAGWVLEESFIRVARTGSTLQNTVYSATASPNKPTADQLGAISRVQLNALTVAQPTRSHEPEPTADDAFGPY
jgi:hypothetical protein